MSGKCCIIESCYDLQSLGEAVYYISHRWYHWLQLLQATQLKLMGCRILGIVRGGSLIIFRNMTLAKALMCLCMQQLPAAAFWIRQEVLKLMSSKAHQQYRLRAFSQE